MKKKLLLIACMLIFGFLCISCFTISVCSTKIIDNGNPYDPVYKYLNRYANWSLWAKHGMQTWHRATGLSLHFTNLSQDTKKLSIEFYNNEGFVSDFRLNFSIDLPIGNYSRNGWVFTYSRNNFTMIFNATDLSNIQDLIFDYGLHGNFFYFTLRKNNVPTGYHGVLDPWYTLVLNGGSTVGTGYQNQHKIFRDKWNRLIGCGYNNSVRNYNVFYNSSNNGLTWSKKTIDGSVVTYNSLGNSIASNKSGIIFYFYGKQSNNKRFFLNLTKSLDNGTTWSTPTKLNPNENYSVAQMSCEFDNMDNLHLVWAGKHTGSTTYTQIRYMKYSKTGTFTPAMNLTACGVGSQNAPLIKVDRLNNLFVIWYGQIVPSGVQTVRFCKYTNITGLWSIPINISYGGWASVEPSLCIDSLNRLRCAYSGLGLSATVYNIMFMFSNDSGITWSKPVNITRTTALGRHQNEVTLSIDSNDKITAIFDGRHALSTTYLQLRTTSTTNCMTWTVPINISSGNTNKRYANCIDDILPKTPSYLYYDIPKTGYAFVFTNSTSIYYQTSDDLVWISTITKSLITVTNVLPVNNTIYNTSVVKCYYPLNFSATITTNSSLLMNIHFFINLLRVYDGYSLTNSTVTFNLSKYWTGYRFQYSQIQNLQINVTDEIGTYNNRTYYFSYIRDINNTIHIIENLHNVTGGYETHYNSTGWYIWNNYTGIITPFHHFTHYVNVTGTHDYLINDTGIWDWANCTNNSLNSSWLENNSWLFLGSMLSLDGSQILLAITLTLWLFFVTRYLDDKDNHILALTQFGLSIPTCITVGILSYSYSQIFGYVMVFLIPVVSLVLIAEGYFKK